MAPDDKEGPVRPYQSTPLEVALEELAKPLREDPEDKPKGLIYHYTTVSALSGMLASKCFWMTDYRYLNDPSEFRYSSAIINACLDTHSGEPALADIRKHLQFFLEYDLGPCIVAFSADPDSLYQWRAYGDDGNGVCIGIEPPDPYIRNLCRVIYTRDDQSAIVEKWVRSFIDTCNRHPTDSLTPDKRAHRLYMILIDLKTRFKHAAYSVEREWRYASFPGDFEMKVREGRKGPVAYFPAESILDGTGLLPIRDIRLGPRQDDTKGKFALQILLRQYGYDPDTILLSKSEIPYGGRY